MEANKNNILINNKSTSIIENIISNFILIKVFNILQKKKSLEILKYNNKIKKILNLSINNYKEYCETYTLIKIELIPSKDVYGKFININEEDKLHYQIFFDNNKDEIKKYSTDKNDNVSKINIEINYKVISFKNLFKDCICLESINFKKFYRNNINNMGGMFYKCSSLKEINLSNFNTNSVTNMSFMFCGCSLLKDINFSRFNTNEVIDMTGMLYKCSSLKGINLSNFNTNNVKYMSLMFCRCYSLEELNLSNFNTNKVINMTRMFGECSSLKELNISSFNINNETDVYNMFYGCSNELKEKIKNQINNLKEEAFGVEPKN